jgi:hypothetical protein
MTAGNVFSQLPSAVIITIDHLSRSPSLLFLEGKSETRFLIKTIIIIKLGSMKG